MKTSEVIITDQKLSREESTKLISNLINKQIDFIRTEHLSNWESNHSVSQDEVEKKVNRLRNKRDELTAFIENLVTNENDTLDIRLQFDIKKSNQVVNTPEIMAVN